MVKTTGQWAEFRFFRPNVRRVDLIGEFNDWRVGQLPMRPDGSGYWTGVLNLPPGTYRFRYCVDGQYFCDFAAFGIEYGPFGPDAIVRIAARGLASANGCPLISTPITVPLRLRSAACPLLEARARVPAASNPSPGQLSPIWNEAGAKEAGGPQAA